MFGIAVELLTGRYHATAYDNRAEGEWPPHPARLYSALTAAWAEVERRDAAEAAALDWLAAQGAPHICASEATFRDAPTTFVPVNDAAVLRTQEKPYASLCEAHEKCVAAEDAMASASTDKERARADRAHASARKKVRAALERARKSLDWNGVLSGKEREALLPGSRGRQARRFPSATPESPTVWYLWPDVVPDEGTRGALDAVAARVVRLGHSASLAACRLVDEGPAPTLSPDPDGPTVLRVPGPGQRERLVEAHERHQGNEPRVLPAQAERYRTTAVPSAVEPASSGLASDFIVFARVSGPRLPAERAVDVAEALRGALMKHADQPPHSVISGHAPEGGVAREPHALYVPLPYVGSRYADGAILGVAVFLPAGVSAEGRRQVLRAIGRWERTAEVARADGCVALTFGRAGALSLERVVGLEHRKTLQPHTWSREARAWTTVTPVALDRNPGKLYSKNPRVATRAHEKAEAVIRTSCRRHGLPDPVSVEVGVVPSLRSAPPTRRFPSFPSTRGKPRRVLVHATLVFSEAVRGPIAIGAGRHRGLGLFWPLGGTS